MATYRKLPVEIEAMRFDGYSHTAEKIIAALDTGGQIELEHRGGDCNGILVKMFIITMEGRMQANDGDWIIQGVKRELYPCKPDIFDATYEEVLP